MNAIKLMIGFVFTAISVQSAMADTAVDTFVKDKIEISGCKFDSSLISKALEIGLGNIGKVNLTLADHIKRNAFNKSLKVVCDVGEAPASVHYDNVEDSIHLRASSPIDANTMANFSHEFLHFYGLDHVDDVRITGQFDVFLYDPTYACHLTAFPDLATRLEIPVSIVTEAAKACAAVHPIASDFNGISYQ